MISRFPLPALGSLGLLLAAFFFQYVMGLAPCKMCIWQRWPHVAAILVGVAILAGAPAKWRWIGFAAMVICAGIAGYHTGVEYGWWEGPASCSGGGDISAMSADDLLNQIQNTAIVRCDEVAWRFLGLSMAAWNGIWSAVLAALWAVRR
ncbi:disulfide bond formation protein B [Paracoccaceae bacterium GXU_MW_L88]